MSEKGKQMVYKLSAEAAAQELEAVYIEAKKFVDKNFKTEDNRDYNIKILAVCNQMIDLKRISKMP
jgi:hypothetical protein